MIEMTRICDSERSSGLRGEIKNFIVSSSKCLRGIFHLSLSGINTLMFLQNIFVHNLKLVVIKSKRNNNSLNNYHHLVAEYPRSMAGTYRGSGARFSRYTPPAEEHSRTGLCPRRIVDPASDGSTIRPSTERSSGYCLIANPATAGTFTLYF